MALEDKALLVLRGRRALSMVSSGWDAYVSASDGLETILDTKDEILESVETIKAESEPDILETLLCDFLKRRG